MSKYICEECQQEFEDGWSAEERLQEFTQNFEGHSSDPEDIVILCDDCYKKYIELLKGVKNESPVSNTSSVESSNVNASQDCERDKS